jgi:hypothetical protein
MKSILAFLSSLSLSLSQFMFPVPKPTSLPPIPTPIQFQQYPQSSISVNWGSLAPDFTIFMEPDMKPCDHLERSISISNLNSLSRPITIRGIKTVEEKGFSQILEIKIYKDGQLVYGPKTLKQFFIESLNVSGISLGTLAGNSTSTYKIVVDFPCEAGNEYQKAKLVFKLKIGKLLTVPSPCPCTCYRNTDGQYSLKSYDKQVFANFDEGEKVSCPNRFTCATVSNP